MDRWRIDQLLDSLPGRQPSLRMLLLDILRSSSLEQNPLVASIAIEQLHPCLAIGPHMHLGNPTYTTTAIQAVRRK
jgi:hypothetical protein